jgi:hypothetical protein
MGEVAELPSALYRAYVCHKIGKRCLRTKFTFIVVLFVVTVLTCWTSAKQFSEKEKESRIS